MAEYVVGLPQVNTVGVRVCPTTQTPGAAIADARSNKYEASRKHATYKSNSHARWSQITVRTSVAGPLPVRQLLILGAPRRHVLAPAAAPRSWIPICSTSLVSWGLSRFGRRRIDDVPITARQYCDNYRQPRRGISHWSRPYQDIQIENFPDPFHAGF